MFTLLKNNTASVCIKLAETILPQIIYTSIKSFPNECCGFILEDYSFQPAFNAISTLNKPSLNSKNSFLIDPETFKNINLLSKRIFAIYHSHTNGIADLSGYDMHSLKDTNIYNLIIGINDHKFTEAKLHLYNQEDDTFFSTSITIGD